MSAPQFMKSNYSDLFGSSMLPALEEIFWSEWATHPSMREQVFKTVGTSTDIYQSTEMHDMPLFYTVAEGTDYTFRRPNQGASKTMSIVKYGLGFSISEEAVDDGKFDFIADAVKKMAKSAKESQEISAMNIFNNGFDSETTSDSQYIFDTDHTLPSGLTFRNELSAAADLSPSSLETALIDFETQFIGDSGIINKLMPKILLVHPTLKRYAKELIGSDLKADTADNNMNSLKSDGLIVLSSPHLTDTDAWFLLSDKASTGMRIVNRKSLETKGSGDDVGFINDSIYYKSRYRETIGCLHPYGVFGSPGV